MDREYLRELLATVDLEMFIQKDRIVAMAMSMGNCMANYRGCLDRNPPDGTEVERFVAEIEAAAPHLNEAYVIFKKEGWDRKYGVNQ